LCPFFFKLSPWGARRYFVWRACVFFFFFLRSASSFFSPLLLFLRDFGPFLMTLPQRVPKVKGCSSFVGDFLFWVHANARIPTFSPVVTSRILLICSPLLAHSFDFQNVLLMQSGGPVHTSTSASRIPSPRLPRIAGNISSVEHNCFAGLTRVLTAPLFFRTVFVGFLFFGCSF